MAEPRSNVSETMNRGKERRPLTQNEVASVEAVLEERRSYENIKAPNINPMLGKPYLDGGDGPGGYEWTYPGL
jgi:hypothetical protein